MKSNIGFKEWVFSEMAVANFGQAHTFKGKNANDITPSAWKWLLDKMTTRGEFFNRVVPSITNDDGTPMTRDQILKMAQLRIAGQQYSQFPNKSALSTPPAVVKSDERKPNPLDVEKEKFLSGVMKREPVPTPADPDKSKYRISDSRMSEHQKKIETAFLGSNKNMVISALAGTGKTTVLRHVASLKKPGEKWLYLVFNKKNQTEATVGKSPFPPDIDVKTTHSFLGQLLAQNGKAGKIANTVINPQLKIGTILDGEWLVDRAVNEFGIPKNLVWPLKSKIQKIAGLAKSYAMNPRNKGIEEEIEDIMNQYDIDGELVSSKKQAQNPNNKDYTQAIVALTVDVLHQSMPGNSFDKRLNQTRDHDDTLWYAATHADELEWPHFDVVLADEVQDFNKAQLLMLKKLKEAGARIIAVGDKNQSIYRFRGADSESFANIESLLNGVDSKTFNLPVNYRSGKKIIDYVNRSTHVKNLEAGRDHEGLVSTDKKYVDAIGSVKNEWDDNKKLSMQTAFIARTNKPLIHTALSLIKSKIPFAILGKDFSEDIIKYVKKIISYAGTGIKTMQIENFWQEMGRYVDDKTRQYMGKSKKEKELTEIKESASAIDEILHYLEDEQWNNPVSHTRINTTDDFFNYIRAVFGGLDNDKEDDAKALDEIDPKKCVILTTAHKSKGLEFERVYVVRNDLFPHPNAKNAKDLEQEDNARYVAYTRATHELHVLSDKNPE